MARDKKMQQSLELIEKVRGKDGRNTCCQRPSGEWKSRFSSKRIAKREAAKYRQSVYECKFKPGTFHLTSHSRGLVTRDETELVE